MNRWYWGQITKVAAIGILLGALIVAVCIMIAGCSVPATVPAFGCDDKYKVLPDRPRVQPICEDGGCDSR